MGLTAKQILAGSARTSLEDAAVAQIKRAGLPDPVRQYRFHPTRDWAFDLAFPDHMLAVEVEGGVFRRGRHQRPFGFMADLEKYNAAALMGWLVYRVSPPTIAARGLLAPRLKLLLRDGKVKNGVATPFPCRVWSRIDRSAGPTLCWPWLGARHDKGYGQLRVDGKAYLVTRVVWWLSHQEDPGERLLLHSCNNPPCCNPRHLRLGSLADNSHDMVLAGNHPKQKLSRDQVVEIRRLAHQGHGPTAIGRMFGVSRTLAGDIIKGKAWGWA